MTIQEKEIEVKKLLNRINDIIGDGNRLQFATEDGDCVVVQVINGEIEVIGTSIEDSIPYFYDI